MGFGRWKPDDLAAYSMQEVASDTPLILCARQDTQKENFELTLCNCPATQFDDIILAQASFPEYKYVKGLHVCGTYAAMGKDITHFCLYCDGEPTLSTAGHSCPMIPASC